MDRATTWDIADTTSYDGLARRTTRSATRATRLVPLAVAVLLIAVLLFGVLLPVAHLFHTTSGTVIP